MGNTVENFAGDGLRGLGDYEVFENNTVMNCYDVNANHDDGFQSWSSGSDGVGTGEVKGIVLRRNTIINYTDPNQPFRGTLQGIGCFDGFYVDWVVENNVIITDHWHGITFLGARNVRIINNTVVDINQESPGPAWIMIDDHKNGTPSENCLIRNNLATKINAGEGVTEDHNLVIDFDWAGRYFVDYAGRDLHLAADSPAIDQGTAELAPSVDHDGVPRPQGAAVDIGAYEWVEPGTPDAGTADGADAGSADSKVDAGEDAADGSVGDLDAAEEIVDGGDAGDGTVDSGTGDGTGSDEPAAPDDKADGGEESSGRLVGYGCGCGAGPGALSAGVFAAVLLLLGRRRGKWLS